MSEERKQDYRPNNSSLNERERRDQIEKINKQNRIMLERLQKVTPVLSKKKLEDDFEIHKKMTTYLKKKKEEQYQLKNVLHELFVNVLYIIFYFCYIELYPQELLSFLISSFFCCFFLFQFFQQTLQLLFHTQQQQQTNTKYFHNTQQQISHKHKQKKKKKNVWNSTNRK